MSSEKGLVIAPTEQLPFKCASSVILFFSAEISFPLIRSFFPKGVGGKFYSFFSSLLSSRRVLSLSLDVENRESYGELRRDAHARRGRRHLSSFSSFPPLRLLRKRERVKEREKFEFFFLLSSGFSSFNGNFCSFLWSNETRKRPKPLLTFFTYYGIYS